MVQEVFLRALEQSRTWLGLRNPVGYLYRAARNEALGRLRKQAVRNKSASELTDGPPVLRGADGNLMANEEAERVSQALTALPVEQREVVVLKIYEEMTFREIAHITGISNNTVASRYRYGLAKLKATLNSEEVPHGRD